EAHPLRLGVSEPEDARAAVARSARMSPLELFVDDDLVSAARKRARGCETHYPSADNCDLCHYPSASLLVSSHARLARGLRAWATHGPPPPTPEVDQHMTTKALSLASTAIAFVFATFAGGADAYDFNDSHFHLTNYIQEGLSLPEFLSIMGDRTGRAAVFGIP